MAQIHPLLNEVHDDALSWTNKLLRQHRLAPVDELIVVREMAWSVVAKVTHEKGVWYFKFLPDYFKHELKLTEYLSNVEPNLVARCIGINESKGYLMVADAGAMLRERYEDKLDASMWYEALAGYAHLQISLMGDDTLLTFGLPDRSLHRIPELVRPNIRRVLPFNGDEEEDQCRAEHEVVLRRALDSWSTLIQPLYQFGIGDSLNHGDFHDGNLAYTDKPIVFDWGDASITHPFMSLRSVFVSIERRFEFEPNSKEFEPFIEAYLSPWQIFATMDELKQMFGQARKVWALVSFLSWSHGIQNEQDSRATHYNFALPSLLREFVDAQDPR